MYLSTSIGEKSGAAGAEAPPTPAMQSILKTGALGGGGGRAVVPDLHPSMIAIALVSLWS